MNFTKIIWGARALIYSCFTKFKMPGYIGKPIYINKIKGLSIEKKVRIYPGIRAEIISNQGKIKIGENTSIGQNFHVVSNDETLKIGKNVVISGNVFITNCEHEYKNINISVLKQPLITKTTEIGDNCFIGYGAVIQAGTKLGKNCIIGSNSVVKGIFPDYSVLAGVPAKIIKQYNKEKNIWEKI